MATIVIAHRGASAVARENTLAAFSAARRLGADMVELDVRATADGALAVHHDARLPGGVPVAAVRTEELPAHVPLLDAALDACAGMEVNVELKDLPGEPGFDPGRRLADAVVQAVRVRGEEGRVLVSSFDLAAVDRVRALAPEIRTAWLTGPGWDNLVAVATCVARGHACVHPHDSAVTEALVQAAHGAGVGVNVWTVDDPDRMRELVDFGVDGICTNVPDVAVAVLRSAGLRPPT